MNQIAVRLKRQAPRALSVLRIAAGLLFIEYALLKLFDLPTEPDFPMEPIFYAAGTIELIGGSLLIAGLWTRVAAFVLSGEMAVAYFHTHAPQSFYPIANHGDTAIMLCFVCLYLVFAGAGAWSVDAALSGRARARESQSDLGW